MTAHVKIREEEVKVYDSLLRLDCVFFKKGIV